MALGKIFSSLGLNRAYDREDPDSFSVKELFRTSHHDGDASRYQGVFLPGFPSHKERHQLGGRSLEYRTLLPIFTRSIRVTHKITPFQAWGKERLRSYCPGANYNQGRSALIHPEARVNSRDPASPLANRFADDYFKNAATKLARKKLIRAFEGKNGSASVDCLYLESLPLLPAQESWELFNCDTLRVSAPNFITSPNTKSVTLHGCPPAFESMEFLTQLPELTHLDVSMSTAEPLDRPTPLLHGRSLHGNIEEPALVYLSDTPHLKQLTLANFKRMPIFKNKGMFRYAMLYEREYGRKRVHTVDSNLREVTIKNCKEPIEAHHLTGLLDFESLGIIDLSESRVNSLPDEFFEDGGQNSFCIKLDPSKISPEVLEKVANMDSTLADNSGLSLSRQSRFILSADEKTGETNLV
jgi:hypothetical protein